MSGVLAHTFQSAKAEGSDATKVRTSKWNDYHVFSGGNNGSILVRDTSDATYGSSWLQSVAAGQVLASAGAGSLPAWSASIALTSVALGTNPAAAGPLRLPNNSYITGRNAANSADVNMFRVNGSNTIDVGAGLECGVINGSTITGSQITVSATGGFSCHAGGFYSFTGRGYLSASADGIWTIQNAAGTSFTRFTFGGTSSSFPALTRNGAVLETKLADNSAYATHAALLFQITTAIVAAGGGAAPTFTTIGGSGPATAAQNGWLKFTDSTGAACYVPVWK